MTATLARPRSLRATETTVFTAATGVAALHALDDAFLNRQPGVGIGQHALAGAIALAGAAAAIVVFPRLRPGVRALLAFTLGVLALINGAMHVQHVNVVGVEHSDATGILAALAGATLILLAAYIPWRHRGERGGRWRVRVPVAVALWLALPLVFLPLSLGVIEVHKWRDPIGPTPQGYQDVAFRSTDGLELTGWYHPPANGATVLLVHGGNGDRQGPLAHARMLVRHGYGVLLYDSRGRGHSEGSPNSYGWDWRYDVEGALRYLHARPDVDDARIGALGISTGADVLLEVMPDRPDLKVVVNDGTAAETWEDGQRLTGSRIESLPGWLMFKAIEVLSGDPPSPVLEDRVKLIRQPLLMVSAGTQAERDFNVMYDRAGGPNVQHWNLPDVGHTAAIRQARVPYEQRVVAFLDDALR